jgi:hypothetical protein
VDTWREAEIRYNGVWTDEAVKIRLKIACAEEEQAAVLASIPPFTCEPVWITSISF